MRARQAVRRGVVAATITGAALAVAAAPASADTPAPAPSTVAPAGPEEDLLKALRDFAPLGVPVWGLVEAAAGATDIIGIGG